MNVVFDLGGVVLTWNPAAITASVFDDEGERSLVRERIFGDPDWARLDRGELSDDDVIMRAEVRTGIQADRLRLLFDTFPRALVPVDPVLELVSQVRGGGNDLYVLSNLHRTCLLYTSDAAD